MASQSLGLRQKNRKGSYKVKYKPTVRVLTVMSILTILFLILFFKLFLLQIFDSTEKYSSQVNQLVEEVSITAERGNIYDRNMNILVQDSSAKSINIIPKLVEDPDEVADVLSDELNLDYDRVFEIATKLEDDKVQVKDNVYNIDTASLLNTLGNDEAYSISDNAFYVIPEKVKNVDADAKAIALVLDMNEETVKNYLESKENSTQLIKSKVDNQLAQDLKDELTIYDNEDEVESTNGIELLEDKKRYYTNGNFASYIIGFTGNDHEGLYGVEKTFNDQLKGTNGIVYYQKDAQGNIITSQTKVIQDSEKGEDLVLSIDSNIQSAVEKALENTVEEWEAKAGTAIVMNVKTGEIISMASKPDYDLNDPYEISDEYATNYEEDFVGLETTEQMELMWKNPAVSFIYEPGSTFKPITISTALEQGAVNPDTTVNCVGSINVYGTTINCTGVHGDQSIAESLENSCNPGLVQIINDVDPNDFYQYVYNFGFGKRTGIELTGEESGIVNRVFDENGNINIVDYSTFSFGQGLATTPIQIVTALSTLINDGYYRAPTIVKSDTVDITKQVVSSSTSSALREDMQGVISSKPELLQLTDNYTMGGKTGTAEKFYNGTYASGKYVTSFFCFSPVDDPEYCAMVILDEPAEGASGATSAAPTAINILKQTLIYNGSNPLENTMANILIPDCEGLNVEDATKILEERGIAYEVVQNGEGDTILTQSIPALSVYNPDNTLILSIGTKSDPNEATLPDFTGMTVQSVNEKVKELGIHLEIKGSGFAIEQSIAPGTPIEKDMNILVKFQE